MPRVKIPSLPSRGPGSSSSFKSQYVKSKRRLESSSSSSSSNESDEDELSYTSTSSDENNVGMGSKQSTTTKKKTSSTLLITPKLITREVGDRQPHDKSPSASSSVLKQRKSTVSSNAVSSKKTQQQQAESNRRKVSFCNVVQDMSSSHWKTPARNQESKKSAMKNNATKGIQSSVSSLTQSRADDDDDDAVVTLVTPPPWMNSSNSHSIINTSSVATSQGKNSMTGRASTLSSYNMPKAFKYTTIAKGDEKKPEGRDLRNDSDQLSSDIWQVQQFLCIAVDTRCLQTSFGNLASQSFIHHLQEFLQSCSHRGILPRIISTPVASSTGEQQQKQKQQENSNKRLCGDGRIHISTQPLSLSSPLTYERNLNQSDKQVQSTSTDHESMFYPMLPRLVIRPPSNVGNLEQRENTVYVPKLLLAHESWTMFASFVQSIAEETKKLASDDAKTSLPLDISIFTNDMALFSDSDVESHRRGMDRFRDKSNIFFEKGIIRSISIIIVDTDTFALWESSGSRSSHKSNSLSKDSHTNQDQQKDPDALRNNKENVERNDFFSKLFNPHRLKVQECLRSMQDRLLLSRDLDSKYRKDGGKSQLIQVRLKVIDCNAISFQSLLVDWASYAVRSIRTNAGMARIRFDLPSTKDGTQCSVTLDLSYAIFPHRLNAPNRLWKDMSLLHECSLHIVQMIPLADIDASLIYGIPFVAKPSAEGELWQFKEMKVLVQQLLKYLVAHQVALVLQCDGRNRPKEIDGDVSARMIGKSDECLYHSYQQIFLLIVEENNATMSLLPNAILYRYANRPDQMLFHGSNESSESMAEVVPGTLDMYYDYVVESLECVQTCSMNPFDQKHEAPSDKLMNEHQLSKDNSGTQSLEQETFTTQSQALTELEATANYSDDDPFVFSIADSPDEDSSLVESKDAFELSTRDSPSKTMLSKLHEDESPFDSHLFEY